MAARRQAIKPLLALPTEIRFQNEFYFLQHQGYTDAQREAGSTTGEDFHPKIQHL